MHACCCKGHASDGIITPGDGSGNRPAEGKTVECKKVGRLINGGKFDDSNADSDKPFRFKLGGKGVITGLSEGVATMEVGEKAVFYIAAEKAYGRHGHPPKIPADEPVR